MSLNSANRIQNWDACRRVPPHLLNDCLIVSSCPRACPTNHCRDGTLISLDIVVLVSLTHKSVYLYISKKIAPLLNKLTPPAPFPLAATETLLNRLSSCYLEVGSKEMLYTFCSDGALWVENHMGMQTDIKCQVI